MGESERPKEKLEHSVVDVRILIVQLSIFLGPVPGTSA